MGSALSTLRALFEDQILDSESTDTTSDPSSTLINSYINKAIRIVSRRERPRELLSATATDLDIATGANTVSITSDIFIVDQVYYKDSGSGKFTEVIQKRYQDLIEIETPANFFDSTNTGDPRFYAVRGTTIVFNTYFDRTATGAIKVLHLATPSTLSSDTDETELPTDYDLLLIYEAGFLFFQRDDDVQNMQKYQILARQETGDLKFQLDTNDSEEIVLDRRTFMGHGRDISNPNVFFNQR